MSDKTMVARYRLGKAEKKYDYFSRTGTGSAAAMAMANDRPIRVSKLKRGYWRFLEVRDVIADLSFRDFLVGSAYAQVRRDA